jgi:hypothetical protein
MYPKGEPLQDYVTRRSNMCPKKKANLALRSQEDRTCARKEREPGITVTRKVNMCPKREPIQDYGHINGEHVLKWSGTQNLVNKKYHLLDRTPLVKAESDFLRHFVTF